MRKTRRTGHPVGYNQPMLHVLVVALVIPFISLAVYIAPVVMRLFDVVTTKH